MTQPDELGRALEEQARAAVTASTVEAIRLAIAKILATPIEGVLAVIERLIKALPRPAMDALMPPFADAARRLGITDATRSPLVPVLDGSKVNWNHQTLPDLDQMYSDGIQAALTLARKIGLESGEDVRHVTGLMGATAAGLDGEVRRIVNEEINAGTAQVARAQGLNLVWYPERDACLDCLAHAGWVVEPGKPFPGVSFDPDAAGKVWIVEHPPLHPNCRCRVRLTDAPAGRPAKTDPLYREARRAVVYQDAGSESRAALRRSAQALLERGAALPESVQNRARKKLKETPVPRNVTVTGEDAIAAVPKGLTVRGTLTTSERKALRDYESAMFVGINGALRRGEVPTVAAAIDRAMAPIEARIEVWRGVQNAKVMFGDRLAEDMTGLVWRDGAYTSTTARERVATEFTSGSSGGVSARLRILVPRGVKAVVISGGGYFDQAEILLARGLTFRVVADNGTDAKGVRLLDVEVRP